MENKENEVIITPEMEEAGANIIIENQDLMDSYSLARAVYNAMIKLALYSSACPSPMDSPDSDT